MRIVVVTDQYSNTSNGTTVSSRMLVKELVKRNHEVRVLTTGQNGENIYICPTYEKGIIPTLARWQGTVIAKADERIIREALTGAELLHCYMPFLLSKKTAKIAKEMGIPCTSGFHVQPENITYNIGMSSCGFMGNFFYHALHWFFYKNIEHIHCPSQFIADELAKHGYKSKLHVISNGVNELFRPNPLPKIPQLKGKFCILMVGRLSKEKRQDVLIKACSLSKHANDIQLILAGHGPKEEKYRRLGSSLPNPVIFGFYSQPDLANLINMCDLYVHAADVEIEAISCIEAFSCGLVPVIANSQLSATKQFALCNNSLFVPGNAQDLADKIDYWIENPTIKAEYSKKYVESSYQYRLDTCVDRMVDMFQEAISDNQKQSL